MELVELTPRLHLLRFTIGQAYLWQDPDGLTLIDTGLDGDAPEITEAIHGLGRDPVELRQLVLTHFHPDHVGSAAALRERYGTPVLAHEADAPMIRGLAPAPEPVLTDWERPIFAQTSPKAGGLIGPPTPVDRELSGGEVLDFGGGARVVHVPGHTDGSIAVHLPEHGVLFTGDTVAQLEGVPILGVFNLDRARAIESFGVLAALDSEIACFGHTDPLLESASTRLRAVAGQLT